MPIYEYRCANCGEAFDKFIRSLNKMPVDIACPACQSTAVQRLMSAPAVHSGGDGGSNFDAMATTPAAPPVFGRKELNAAQEKKQQLKEQVQYEAKADKKKAKK